MADPGEDKKRTKLKIENGKSIFAPQQKQQQNITSYPSLLLSQTRPSTKEMQIKHIHKQTHTYRLRRRMADPGKDKKKTKIKIEHGKLIFAPQQKQQLNITSYPSLLFLQTRPNTNEMENQAHTQSNTNLLPAQKNGRSR